jgi:hypothetical protein
LNECLSKVGVSGSCSSSREEDRELSIKDSIATVDNEIVSLLKELIELVH